MASTCVAHVQEYIHNFQFIDAASITQVPWHQGYDVGQPQTAREVTDLEHTNKVYSFKCFALYYTSLDEALFLDSDSLPMQDPAKLFDQPDYRRHGNQFSKDHVYSGHTGCHLRDGAYLIHLLDPPWQGMEISREGWQQAEPGQFLFNRWA